MYNYLLLTVVVFDFCCFVCLFACFLSLETKNYDSMKPFPLRPDKFTKKGNLSKLVDSAQ